MKTKIKKIGFEIEGEWSHECQCKMQDNFSGQFVGDGTIDRCCDELSPIEYNSVAFPIARYRDGEMKKVFSLLQKEMNKKEFHYNSSSGFHIHFSFNNEIAPELWSMGFYDFFMKRLLKYHKEITEDRLCGSWAGNIPENEKDLNNSNERYRPINISGAMRKHKTIEFRIFPTDTPKRMYQYLEFTIKSIEYYLNAIEKNSRKLTERLYLKEKLTEKDIKKIRKRKYNEILESIETKRKLETGYTIKKFIDEWGNWSSDKNEVVSNVQFKFISYQGELTIKTVYELQAEVDSGWRIQKVRLQNGEVVFVVIHDRYDSCDCDGITIDDGQCECQVCECLQCDIGVAEILENNWRM